MFDIGCVNSRYRKNESSEVSLSGELRGSMLNFILKNFRPEPPPPAERPKIIIFEHGTTSEMK